MWKDFKTFLWTIGIPALLIACAGICLIRYEIQSNAARQALFEQKERRFEEEMEKRNPPREHRTERPEAGRPRDERPRVQEGPHPGPHPRPSALARIFSAESSATTARILWIGGCMLALLFLAFGVGGWILVRAARRAHEEALKRTDFLSNISHEFKTPLTTICLCAELAQDEGLGAARRQKALQSILSEANRLKGLVLNALDFSRLEKHHWVFRPAACDLTPLIADAAEPLRERFPEGLSLPADAARAKVDENAFKQLIVILLDNAAKYAAFGGPVEVACAPRGPHVAVTVSDRGPGLDKNGFKHAFDRFWRGDSATTAETGGSGLGLSIAKGIARGMGGDLAVAPREGGGLVFTLTVPKETA